MSLFDRILNAGYTIKIYKIDLNNIYDVHIYELTNTSFEPEICDYCGNTLEEAIEKCVEYLGV